MKKIIRMTWRRVRSMILCNRPDKVEWCCRWPIRRLRQIWWRPKGRRWVLQGRRVHYQKEQNYVVWDQNYPWEENDVAVLDLCISLFLVLGYMLFTPVVYYDLLHHWRKAQLETGSKATCKQHIFHMIHQGVKNKCNRELRWTIILQVHMDFPLNCIFKNHISYSMEYKLLTINM